MAAPTLSVGITNYNHARFLVAALDSILSQSWQDFELIIIDDASTDESASILRSYANKYSAIRLIENDSNQGVVANVLSLLGLARGAFYYAAAADDFVLPGFFERSIAMLTSNPSAGLCSSLSYSSDVTGQPRNLKFFDPFGGKQLSYHFGPAEVRDYFSTQIPWIQGNTVIYRKNALLSVGGFRSELGSFTDGFVQHLVALTFGVCFIPEPLAVWRQVAGSFSSLTSLNPSENRRIRDTARSYMLGEYKNIFPARYVSRWEGRWDSGILLAYTRAKRHEWLEGLHLALVPGKTASAIFLWTATLMSFVGMFPVFVTVIALRWFDLRAIIGFQLERLRYDHSAYNVENGGKVERPVCRAASPPPK